LTFGNPRISDFYSSIVGVGNQPSMFHPCCHPWPGWCFWGVLQTHHGIWHLKGANFSQEIFPEEPMGLLSKIGCSEKFIYMSGLIKWHTRIEIFEGKKFITAHNQKKCNPKVHPKFLSTPNCFYAQTPLIGHFVWRTGKPQEAPDRREPMSNSMMILSVNISGTSCRRCQSFWVVWRARCETPKR